MSYNDPQKYACPKTGEFYRILNFFRPKSSVYEIFVEPQMRQYFDGHCNPLSVWWLF